MIAVVRQIIREPTANLAWLEYEKYLAQFPRIAYGTGVEDFGRDEDRFYYVEIIRLESAK